MPASGPVGGSLPLSYERMNDQLGGYDRLDQRKEIDAVWEGEAGTPGEERTKSELSGDRDFKVKAGEDLSLNEPMPEVAAESPALQMTTTPVDISHAASFARGRKRAQYSGWYGDEEKGRLDSYYLDVGGRLSGIESSRGERWAKKPYREYEVAYTYWLSTLFPQVPAASKAPAPPKDRWPAEARAIAEGLLRRAAVSSLTGGLAVDRRSESFDPLAGALTHRSRSLWLASPKAWLDRVESDNAMTIVQWCDGRERAIVNAAFLLGRTRGAEAADLENAPYDFAEFAFGSLEQRYATHAVELKAPAQDQALLILRHPDAPGNKIHVLVDTRRRVVLRVEHRHEGKVTSAQQFGDFVEIAGAWWAGRSESFDAENRRVGVTTTAFAAAPPDDFARRFQEELALKEKVQFLREPGRTLADAKRAAAEAKADFDDQMTLLLHFARSQQWTRVFEHLDAAEKLAAGKPGLRWVRAALLRDSRRHEDLKRFLSAEAGRLAQARPPTRDDLPLADYLLGQAESVLEPNEQLILLDTVQPVYARQPDPLHGLKRWRSRRADGLQRAGRAAEALDLWRQLVEAYPRDLDFHLRYSQALWDAGRFEDAYAALGKALAGADRLPHEEFALRDRYADFLSAQGRYEDLVEFTGAWIAREPQWANAYARHLSALIRIDRVDDANALMTRWLAEGRSPDRLPPAAAARLDAAVSQALGQGHQLYSDRIDERWLKPLAEAAIFFSRHPAQAHIAERIMTHWRFQQTDECRGVRRAALEILKSEIARLKPNEIQRLVNWILSNDPAVEKDAWTRLAADLRTRWASAEKPAEKHALGQTLASIGANRLDAGEHLAFLHQQHKEGPAAHRPAYARQLFDALTAQPWSSEYEDEAFELIERLGASEDAGQRLIDHVGALYVLTDRMVQARFQAKMKALAHPETLSRAELKARQADDLKLARQEYADRLAREAGKRSGPIARWMDVERLTLDVILGRDLGKVAAACWEILGDTPRKIDVEAPPERWVDEALRHRALLTLANLACRKGAEPAAIDRLTHYINQGMALDKEDRRWQLLKYQLLIGLDRPTDLQQALQAWIRAGDPDNRWKVALGYLWAEQGKLAEAIRLFEAVAAADELGPAEHRALADWYMAADRREQHRQALVASYKTQDEWRLNNFLHHRLQPWQRSDGKPPAELDPQVLLVFSAIFEKSGSPQNYLWLLGEFYKATRDFRLLSGLADAVVGHTAGKVYPFLQGMGGVLGEVRDEATADSVVEHLAKVRARAKTEIDQRALDLLEALVERRGAELLNQPGPHAEKALAALQRSFKRAWSPGEPRLLADLLAGLGAIAHPALAAEQVRQLEALHRQAESGSADRLHIALRLANVTWSYARHANAIDLLQDALGEFEKAQGGVLPASANDALGTLVSYLEQRTHHARGETILFGQLKHPVHAQQKLWLTQRLYELYEHAVRRDGDVSLGRGATLYKAAEKKILADLDTHDHNHRYNLVNRLCTLYRAAHEKRLGGAVDDLRAFAFRRMPGVLKHQTNNYSSMVGTVAHTLRDLAGHRDGLAFLIERIEREPAWFRWNNQDGWSQHGWQMHEWRTHVKDLGDLEPRLLKITTAELRRDLESRNARNRAGYHRQNSYYWESKTQDFRNIAESVYAERKGSGAAVAYIAEYLFWGLNHRDRAIEILFIAHKDKLLGEGGQWTLVDFLHHCGRYGESIALLQALVDWRPDTMNYRVYLMHAYFRTNRKAELLALLEETDARFHKDGRWTEAAMAALADSCLQNQLYERSVAYYKELIPLHQRTQPNRGIGNGTLSGYYGGMGRAYAGLGKTAEAVDAACGAIVSWGFTHHNRANAIRALLDVVRQAPNLDAYVAELDKQAAETGLQNPLVRKAIGQIYVEKQAYVQAIAQLALACELQPNDLETHQALIACYDKQKDPEGAIRQVLASLQLARRQIALYEDLGKRFDGLKQPKEAERAYTSIAEVLPSESESHTLLAEIRQRQDRWGDAIVHWGQVARIRALEPIGLLKLAEAQVHVKRWDDADDTLRRLRAKGWPSRFGDVLNQIRELERKIESGRRK
jgi:tetratricopeptide (TPR) repeat protein